MIDPPLVSIVTPSFNQARYLPQAIDSVLAQDYPALECVVVDGGSTDGSAGLLERYGDRIRWTSEPDRGQAHALNKGFDACRGDVLGWINSDDVLLPGAVARVALEFQRQSDLGLVSGRGWVIDADGRRLYRFPFSEPFNLWRLIYFGDTILQQSAFFSRKAFEAAGGLDESLNWGMDWNLFLEISKRFRTRTIQDDLGCIRVYGQTKTATGGRRRLRELGNVVRRHSGRRYAPSYFGFMLDAAYGAARAQADRIRRSPSALHRGVDWAHDLLGRFILPAMQESQGWYEDGWASRQVHALFPLLEGAYEIEAIGEIPAGVQGTITMRVNGLDVVDWTLEPGDFALRRPMPQGLDGPVHVELLAQAPVSRAPRPLHGGKREHVYRLSQIRILDPGGEVCCGPPGDLLSRDVESSRAAQMP